MSDQAEYEIDGVVFRLLIPKQYVGHPARYNRDNRIRVYSDRFSGPDGLVGDITSQGQGRYWVNALEARYSGIVPAVRALARHVGVIKP